MSLINKMLQDLEQRHAEEGAGQLPPAVRATPTPQRRTPWPMLAALCFILLCALAAWMALRPRAIEPAAPPQGRAAPAAAAPMPAAAAAPAAAAVVPAAAPPSGLNLKVDDDLSMAPLEQTPAATVAPAGQARQENEAPEMQERAPQTQARHRAEPAQERSAQQGNAQDRPPQKTPAAALRPVHPEPKAQPDTAQKSATAEQPIALNKQVKEWTPQQKAENDYRQATTLIQQGRVQEASALLEQVLQTDPSNAGARQTLIALMLDARRRDDAMRLAQQGLALDGRQTNFAMILARLQLDKGDQKAAIATLQRSLPAAGGNAEYQAFLAALMQREGRHAEAIDLYEAALDREPQNGVWWMGLGISLQADNRPQPAREAFMHARETASLSPALQAFVEQKIRQLSH